MKSKIIDQTFLRTFKHSYPETYYPVIKTSNYLKTIDNALTMQQINVDVRQVFGQGIQGNVYALFTNFAIILRNKTFLEMLDENGRCCANSTYTCG